MDISPVCSIGEVVDTYLVSVGAIVTAIFAVWRFKVADQTLSFGKYRKAVRQYSEEVRERPSSPYLARLDRLAMLAQVAQKHPSDYHVLLMRMFEEHLGRAPVYGDTADGDSVVDPDSLETATVIRAIERRTLRQKCAEQRERYEFQLPPQCPFQFRDEKFCLTDTALEMVQRYCEERGINSRFLRERHPRPMTM